MLQATRALVLRRTAYGETSLVLRMYTEGFGAQSYLVNGARSPRSRLKAVFFQVPNLLELQVDHREGRDLQRIREVRMLHVYQRIPFSMPHTASALFAAEVLGKCLREGHAQDEVYYFVEHSLLHLDAAEDGLAWFPLWFLLGLSQVLGFAPQGRQSGAAPFFDLKEGMFTGERPARGLALEGARAGLLSDLLERMEADPAPVPELDNRMVQNPDLPLAGAGLPAADADALPQAALRLGLLDDLLRYFALHVDGFGAMRSPAVLHEVLRAGG
jgi:DNA repair protein RecO (recombination protein O)